MYETLLNKYGVKQLGYVVKNIEETAELMCKMWGAGPFVITGENTPEVCIYRGEESTMTSRVAMGQFGDMQIELIQPVSEGPNVYTEFGRYGFHHVCIWTDDLDQTMKEFEEAGFEQAVYLESVGFRVAYYDCVEAFGHYVEVCAPQEDVYEGIASMAEDWEGEPACYSF